MKPGEVVKVGRRKGRSSIVKKRHITYNNNNYNYTRNSNRTSKEGVHET